MSITLQELIDANLSRAKRWHHGDINEWSALEWAGAMCGEAGEAANAAKKLKRIEDGIASINHDEDHLEAAVSELHGRRHYADAEQARSAVGKEVADTIIYALLVAARCDIDIETAIIEVFNKKSEEYGFPERLTSRLV